MSSATRPISPLDPRAETRALLSGVGLFVDLKDERAALDALSGIMQRKLFERGTTIVQEGAEGTEMYVLIEGDVGVFKSTPGGDEYIVAALKASTRPAFGEGSLVDSDRRTATIRAQDDCICLVLDRPDFEEFSRAYPQWALPIYRRIATGVMTRLRRTNDDMLLLYNALVSEIRGG